MSAADWRLVGVAGTIIALIVAAHGITSKRWQSFHTIGVVVGVVAAVGPRVGK